MSDPLIYRLGGRGTGKTTRLVKATPSGGIYVVDSQGMKGIIENYIKEIGRDGEITVSTTDNLKLSLRGVCSPIAIDHNCFDIGLEDNVREAIFMQPLVLTNDYQGDVITSYKPNGA